MAKTEIKGDVIEFLKSLDASPNDEQVHDWAEEKGYDVPEVEAVIYSLAFDSVGKKESLKEADEIDKLTMDVPLITRLFEYFLETELTDEELHNVLTRAIEESKSNEVLTMDQYSTIVGESQTEKLEELYKRIVK